VTAFLLITTFLSIILIVIYVNDKNDYYIVKKEPLKINEKEAISFDSIESAVDNYETNS
jgi:hypothetical protein